MMALIPDMRRRLDRLGLVLSGLCALHCVVSLLLISAIGFGSQWFLSPDIHRYGLAAAVITAAGAIGWGMLRHRRRLPMLVASIGLAFMCAALLVEHGVQEAILTLIGVAIVSTGHILNLRLAH
ncbi:MAG: MerC domain-containing protein [Sphingomonadaceae bacterium]